MVSAAVYIRDKLVKESILAQALATAIKKADEMFGLVLVGHSLGAGTAAILAILLRQSHPDLQCFAYSPPGGLLRYFLNPSETIKLFCRCSKVGNPAMGFSSCFHMYALNVKPLCCQFES